jgi:hypothetical protein
MSEWKSPIPLKVHLIWIGDKEYPDYFKLFLKSFYKYLPEFDIRVWGNKDLTRKNFPKTWTLIQSVKKLQGTQMYDEDGKKLYTYPDEKPMTYSKFAQITDLMRLEIVYNEGGYYFDTTFEILKPLYNLFNKSKYKFVSCNEVPRFKDYPKLSNSFFGATPGNPILKRLLQKKRLDKVDIYEFSVEHETGPHFFRSGIYKNDNYKIFPSYYFYPFVEPIDSYSDPPYRKSSKNKCHRKTIRKTKRKNTNRKTKRKQRFKKLQSNKGYILYPCKNYPKSYALKHWQLGKSWLNWLESITLED